MHRCTSMCKICFWGSTICAKVLQRLDTYTKVSRICRQQSPLKQFETLYTCYTSIPVASRSLPGPLSGPAGRNRQYRKTQCLQTFCEPSRELLYSSIGQSHPNLIRPAIETSSRPCILVHHFAKCDGLKSCAQSPMSTPASVFLCSWEKGKATVTSRNSRKAFNLLLYKQSKQGFFSG